MIQLTDPFVIGIYNNSQAWQYNFTLFDRDERGNLRMPEDKDLTLTGPLKDRTQYFSYQEFMQWLKAEAILVQQMKSHVTAGNRLAMIIPMEYRQYYKSAERKPPNDYVGKLLQPGPPGHEQSCTYQLKRELSFYSRLIFDISPYTHLMLYFYNQS